MKSEEKEEEIGGKFCPSERKANKNRSQASTGKRMEPEKNNNAQADYHLIKEEEKESEAQGRLIPPTASSFSTGPTIQSSAESMLSLTNGKIYVLKVSFMAIIRPKYIQSARRATDKLLQ